ncbi:MAG: DEAD/DEAH box helicase [Acidaminococcales bacterium]|jgi:ATP-dependent RNA helicase DeaD|nr:DEAD/DEAH box helicase [Acidaminococcales bacterium]
MTDGFALLGIKDEILRLLPGIGLKKPMPVQAAAIPPILKGRDVLLKARTGTGKTMAFIIPAVHKADSKKTYPQALIVTPTRELAVQVAGEAKKIAGGAGLKVLNILGGRDFYAQKDKLGKAPHILVGTPGRLLDHLRKRSAALGGVSFFVLDEVDEMLQRGFLEDIEQLSLFVGAKRQTVVCSATLPQAAADLAKKIMKAPVLVDIDADKLDTVNIEHWIMKVSADKKKWALGEFLRRANPYLAIVFCGAREGAAEIGEWLETEGFSCGVLRGDLSQTKRLKVLRDFRRARIQVLVATDLAARGLDVEGVSHVISYDPPPDRQQYVHRAGRTGRAGAAGMAVTIYTPEELRKIDNLEKKLGFKFRARNPAGDEITRASVKKPAAGKKRTVKPPGPKHGARR